MGVDACVSARVCAVVRLCVFVCVRKCGGGGLIGCVGGFFCDSYPIFVLLDLTLRGCHTTAPRDPLPNVFCSHPLWDRIPGGHAAGSGDPRLPAEGILRDGRRGASPPPPPPHPDPGTQTPLRFDAPSQSDAPSLLIICGYLYCNFYYSRPLNTYFLFPSKSISSTTARILHLISISIIDHELNPNPLLFSPRRSPTSKSSVQL